MAGHRGDTHDELRRLSPPLDRRPRRFLGRAGRSWSTGRRRPSRSATTANPPFARWFVGGTTNLCHNAVDRHLKDRADQAALIFVSTETDQEKVYTFRELHAEVQRMAAVLKDLGVQQGRPRADLHADDRRGGVCHAGLRAHRRDPFGGVRRLCVRLRWPSRIEDAAPKVIVSADAGSRGGKVVAYKPLLDEAIRLSSAQACQRCCWSTAAWRRWTWSPAATTTVGRAARQAPERHGALRVGGRHPPQLHALHQRHHRQAQGRAARHRRLRRGAGRAA